MTGARAPLDLLAIRGGAISVWRFAAVLMLACCAACGGVEAGRPTQTAPAVKAPDPGSGPFLCSAADGLTFTSIEDFELGAAGGGWYANNDVCDQCQTLGDDIAQLDITLAQNPSNADALERRQSLLDQLQTCRTSCVASQQPNIFDKPLPAERIPHGGRCGSSYALHVHAQLLTGWGGNVGLRFTPVRDASQWKGISFWARVAPGSRNAIRLELADRYTDEKYVGPDGAPICNPFATVDYLESGCDKFGGYAVLNGDWHFFLLPFDELRQAGWGMKSPGLELSALRTLAFTFGPGAWDIWIDDVAFYR